MENKGLVVPRVLSGFKDRLPKEALFKANTLQKLSQVFLSFGFMPIETPHIEYQDILTKQDGDDVQKEMYKFEDNGKRKVALRFDQTVPLARFISQHRKELEMPFKRYVIGNVFRGERTQKGRYREFTQCDFDFIGSNSLSCDGEIVQVIYSCMQKLDIEEFTIWINHREILNGIFKHFGIQNNIQDAIRIIDKFDKIGLDEVKKELQAAFNLESKVVDELCLLATIKQIAPIDEFFAKISYLKDYNENLNKGISDLEEMFKILKDLDIDISSCRVNFSIARGLGYYTGIVYETTLNRLKSIGSICSGGRYDNLTKTFSDEHLSGVGASIGLDRLLSALEELHIANIKSTSARILIISTNKDYLSFSHKIANAFRLSNINTEVFPDITKIKKALKYSNLKGHEFSIIIGDSEFKSKTLTVKNMTTGMQFEEISFLKALEILKDVSIS